MGKMKEYLMKEPEMRKRFVKKALEEDSNIKDFGDFTDAFLRAFNTAKGKGALSWMDEDEMVLLFKEDEVRSVIERNIGKKKAEEIYEIADRTDLVVTRAKPVGEKISPRQFRTTIAVKQVKVPTHTWKGKKIGGYSRGFQRWTPAQMKFIQVRKEQNLTPKQIAHEYNKQFKSAPRSKSSISSKVYRL